MIYTPYTSSGDAGDLALHGKTYRKGSPLTIYNAALIALFAKRNMIPNNWDEFNPRRLFDNILFYLQTGVATADLSAVEVPLEILKNAIITQCEYITAGLNITEHSIIATFATGDMHELYAAILQTENLCVAAHDYIELSSGTTSPNLLKVLATSATLLNALSKWVSAFCAAYSIDANNQVSKDALIRLLSVDELKGLDT